MEEVNSRLMEIVVYSGLSQKEFALKIGVSQPTITYISTGRNKVSLDVVQRICSNYPEVNVGWLVMGQGLMLDASSGVDKDRLIEVLDELRTINKLNYSNITNSLTSLKQLLE
jgi:transcriptional regulator with XRE-family HTH domain